MNTKVHDCLIIGGGPAGLTAAIYMARYLLDVRVVDGGDSRAGWIPMSYNHAGFPDGISGNDLLGRMGDQALRYGAALDKGRVMRLDVDPEGGFSAEWGNGGVRARTVLLATGVTNRRPEMDIGKHDEALARGLIRYCPICDGYEVKDKRVGVIGTDEHGLREALFLRSYTADVTLVSPTGDHNLDDAQRSLAAASGIVLIDGSGSAVQIDGDRVAVATAAGPLLFDDVYPALGSDVHSSLARMIGADVAEDGCVVVDDHQRSSVPGLYAAGDVVMGLDQISHAVGEGGVAATTIRNDLGMRHPLLRGKAL